MIISYSEDCAIVFASHIDFLCMRLSFYAALNDGMRLAIAKNVPLDGLEVYDMIGDVGYCNKST